MRALGFIYLLLVIHPSIYGKTYDDISQTMSDIRDRHNATTELIQLGPNDQLQIILGLKITSYTHEPNISPTILCVAGVHGDEIHTSELALKIIQTLLNNPSQKLIERQHAYMIIPVLNISGYNQQKREELNSKQKFIDPNRDFLIPQHGKKSYQLASTKALATYIDEHSEIFAAVAIHETKGSLTFPWGVCSNDPRCKDYGCYLELTRYCCSGTSYQYGSHGNIIYACEGSFEDWAYATYGIWTVLLEMGDPVDYDQDVDVLMRFFERVPHERSKQHRYPTKKQKK